MPITWWLSGIMEIVFLRNGMAGYHTLMTTSLLTEQMSSFNLFTRNRTLGCLTQGIFTCQDSVYSTLKTLNFWRVDEIGTRKSGTEVEKSEWEEALTNQPQWIQPLDWSENTNINRRWKSFFIVSQERSCPFVLKIEPCYYLPNSSLFIIHT